MGWYDDEELRELFARVEALEVAAGIKAPLDTLAPGEPRVTRRVGDIAAEAPPVPIPEPRPEDLRRWQIWTEGYSATNQSAPATYHGTYLGFTWDCAVASWARQDQLRVEFTPGVGYTLWGCRVYDNETAARAIFG